MGYVLLLALAALLVAAGLILMFGWLPVALIAAGLSLAAWVTRREWAPSADNRD